MTDHEAPVGECPPESLRFFHVPKPPLGRRPVFLDKLVAAEARIAELEQDKANLQRLLNLTDTPPAIVATDRCDRCDPPIIVTHSGLFPVHVRHRGI